MTLADTLRDLDVRSMNGPINLDCTLHEPGGTSLPLRQLTRGGVGSMVSCLMVTTGERYAIRSALECYRRQLYDNRELVIVTYLDRAGALRDLLDAEGVDAELHGVGRDLSLGEMRNVAVARSHGHLLIQWDDDDLSDPARITVAEAILSQTLAAALLLRRVLIWWPERELAAISTSRLWEGSIAMWRADAPIYPSLNRMEDTHALEFLTSTRAVASCDLPLLYVYVVHGRNTCEEQHFEGHVGQAACVFRGQEFADLTQMLAGRMPILDYRPGQNL